MSLSRLEFISFSPALAFCFALLDAPTKAEFIRGRKGRT